MLYIVGIVQLVNGRIIYIKNGGCKQWLDSDCLHIKAYRIALEDQCIPHYSPLTIRSRQVHKYSKKHISIISDSSNIHNYKISDNRWYCIDCIGTNSERKHLLNIMAHQKQRHVLPIITRWSFI